MVGDISPLTGSRFKSALQVLSAQFVGEAQAEEISGTKTAMRAMDLIPSTW